MRRRLILGNWKMHKTVSEAEATVQDLLDRMKDYRGPYEWGIAPPFTAISALRTLREGTSMLLGAQNCHPEPQGAFTGEISVTMLQDLGVDFVIVGHSERRHIFGEDDAFIARKVRAVLDHGMTPVLCIGERLEEREQGHTEAVVKHQLLGSLAHVSPEEIPRVVLAYEPVWAIGTGKTATPETAQEVHAFIRTVLRDLGADAEEVTILYGGSVKPENVTNLTRMPDIDGALVGGASLQSQSFAHIINAAFPNA